MSLDQNTIPIRVGVLTDEPLRMVGLHSIFEDGPGEGYTPLTPIIGTIDELLADPTLEYMVVDMNASSGGLRILDVIRVKRPRMRLIVIGPENDDTLVLESIMAGARAYLDLRASPRIVRQAIEVVTSGSIWASRRLLSTLIDRLMGGSDTSLTNDPPQLTDRERQVLDLILTARSNREIARELGIEERTVQAHVGRLMRKTGADNRIDLLMRASSPALLEAAGIKDRRTDDRRRDDRRGDDRRYGDRRRYLDIQPRPVTPE
jgi:DNA-binding NarL/FixJ family response regulator